MVNGRSLEDEFKRIENYFNSLSIEEFEEMALDCGAEVIVPSEKSKYVEAIPKRYANKESMKRCHLEEAKYIVTPEEAEAA